MYNMNSKHMYVDVELLLSVSKTKTVKQMEKKYVKINYYLEKQNKKQFCLHTFISM